MPNWAEGTLKVRGKREDIRNFLVNGLEGVNYGGVEEELRFEEDNYSFEMWTNGSIYIKETRRAFITESIDWYFEDDEKEILCLDFKQAWGVEAEQFKEISKKYNVDFNIYAFEKGMEFNQAIEIVNGNIVKDKEITFDDYKWECLFPNLGG